MNTSIADKVLETNNPDAFLSASEGLRHIDNYRSSHSLKSLEVAKEKFQDALRKDPDFPRARYFTGLILDLLGNPDEAVEILAKLSKEDFSFQDEIKYGLATAHFHLYYEDEVQKSIELLTAVIDNTANELLRYMARATRARCYAMMVLHSGKQSKDNAHQYYENTRHEYQSILDELRTSRALSVQGKKEVLWRTYNAVGTAENFYSDLSDPSWYRIKSVRRALKYFKRANHVSPKNWEVVCNLGSSHMRLGFLYRQLGEISNGITSLLNYLPMQRWASSKFSMAKKELNRVIENIRPNYGFALYELARTYRLSGQFDKAKAFHHKAEEIPERERNVTDTRLRQQYGLIRDKIDTQI